MNNLSNEREFVRFDGKISLVPTCEGICAMDCAQIMIAFGNLIKFQENVVRHNSSSLPLLWHPTWPWALVLSGGGRGALGGSSALGAEKSRLCIFRPNRARRWGPHLLQIVPKLHNAWKRSRTLPHWSWSGWCLEPLIWAYRTFWKITDEHTRISDRKYILWLINRNSCAMCGTDYVEITEPSALYKNRNSTNI